MIPMLSYVGRFAAHPYHVLCEVVLNGEAPVYSRVCVVRFPPAFFLQQQTILLVVTLFLGDLNILYFQSIIEEFEGC